MDINNYYALVGDLLLTAGVLFELSTIPRLVRQVQRPHDGFSRLRVYVLVRPIIYVLTFSPFIVRLFQLTSTPPQTNLAALIQVSVPFGLLCLAIFTYLSYTYKETK